MKAGSRQGGDSVLFAGNCSLSSDVLTFSMLKKNVNRIVIYVIVPTNLGHSMVMNVIVHGRTN
jgi:hypothetical protein